MIYVYGYLPTVFTDLKSFTLGLTSGSSTVTLSTSAEGVDFETAIGLLSTALSSATGADMTATWHTATGRVTIVSASGATWAITAWKARGFFGFDYPIKNTVGATSGPPMGAQRLEGLTINSIDTVTASEGRDLYGDSYQKHSGTTLDLSGFIRPEEMRTAHRATDGYGSELGWAAYKGRVVVIDTAGDSGAWSITNPTGYVDGRLVSAKVDGTISVLGAELGAVSMKVAL